MSSRLPTDYSTVRSSSERHSPRAVLVTGGSGGIGRAVCLAFAQAGWTVGVHYFSRPTEAAATLASVREMSGRSTLYRADIRSSNEVQAMIETFMKDHGRLHAMVCNAGIAAGHLVMRHPNEEWARIIETNLTGSFHCIRTAAAAMVPSGGGSLVVIGSYAGAQGDRGQAAYASAKAGLLGLVRTAGLEWGQFNIRINLVYPGLHRTALGRTRSAGRSLEDHLLDRTPIREEVARTICHLAGLQDISGQVWNLDSRPV
jgi:3-oxoacyl-[acyl-carrier protein] reductase